MSNLTRITINLGRRASDALASAIARTGDSQTDCINRALPVYDVILRLAADGEGSFTVLRADGSTERVTLL